MSQEDPWESHGFQQCIIHRWQEISMEIHKPPRESIEFHGTPWIDMNWIPWNGGIIHRSQEISM